MEKRHVLLIIALLSAIIFIIPNVHSVFAGQHWFYDNGGSYCLKCHTDIRQELDASTYHQAFKCENCHVIDTTSNSTHGNVVNPRCLDCHSIPPHEVTDSNNNIIVAKVAKVFGENNTDGESHDPLVNGAKITSLMKGENEACIFCHSSYGTSITYTRPGFIEWDVENSSGTWMIRNLTIGPDKKILATKNSDARLHNISAIPDINCISCHGDIRNAVLAGGHSGNSSSHNYAFYADMNSYCDSCHKPETQNENGVSPYPGNPFDLPIHSTMKITCLDCHDKSGSLYVNVNGVKISPPYNSTVMGGIETSIRQQPPSIQSYLCIACKNTGNPVPNASLHFKLYTEPEVTIYVNGTQQYP